MFFSVHHYITIANAFVPVIRVMLVYQTENACTFQFGKRCDIIYFAEIFFIKVASVSRCLQNSVDCSFERNDLFANLKVECLQFSSTNSRCRSNPKFSTLMRFYYAYLRIVSIYNIWFIYLLRLMVLQLVRSPTLNQREAKILRWIRRPLLSYQYWTILGPNYLRKFNYHNKLKIWFKSRKFTYLFQTKWLKQY